MTESTVTPRRQPGATPPAAHPAAPLVLALLCVGWLVAMLWSTRSTIGALPGGGALALTSTAYALPGVISASLLSGVAVSLAAAAVLARRGGAGRTRYFLAMVGAGLAMGVLAALAVTIGHRGEPAVMILAATTAAAATVAAAVSAGAAGGAGPAGGSTRRVAGAVVAAGLAVFAVGFAVSWFQEPLLDLYGAGESQASQLTAFTWLSRTASAVSGLAAGLIAFGYLRWALRRDPAGAAPPWTGYLIAGGGPGLLLLTAEALTRTAGSRVLDAAGALSEADRVAQGLLSASRVNHALVVLFIGALVATIAVGRTLRPVPEPAGPGD